MEMYGKSSIMTIIRLRWLRHVQRLPEQRITKQTLIGAITGRRPRTKWMEVAEKNLHQLQIRNWKQLARNKKEWRSMCNEAMGLLDLLLFVIHILFVCRCRLVMKRELSHTVLLFPELNDCST